MKTRFGLSLVIILLCLGGGPFISTRPVPVNPPQHVTVELDGKVRRDAYFPLRLTFSSDEVKQRLYSNFQFMYLVLDEHGAQVGVPDMFIRDAVIRSVDLSAKSVVYEPRLAIDQHLDVLKPNTRYQFVAVMPDMALIGATWFTLED